MSFFENNSVFFSPLMAEGDGPHGFNDKRNRNPNWTDHEIVRFLEILQEEDTMKDLMAQRNKQVICRHSSVKLEELKTRNLTGHTILNSALVLQSRLQIKYYLVNGLSLFT